MEPEKPSITLSGVYHQLQEEKRARESLEKRVAELEKLLKQLLQQQKPLRG